MRKRLSHWKTFFQVKKRHVHDLGKLNLTEELSSALERFNLQTKQWKKWTVLPLTENQIARTMETMKFGKKSEEEVEHRVAQEMEDCDEYGSRKITLWAFYNVLTWYITHRTVSLNHRVEMERRLRIAIEVLVTYVFATAYLGLSERR